MYSNIWGLDIIMSSLYCADGDCIRLKFLYRPSYKTQLLQYLHKCLTFTKLLPTKQKMQFFVFQKLKLSWLPMYLFPILYLQIHEYIMSGEVLHECQGLANVYLKSSSSISIWKDSYILDKFQYSGNLINS